MHISIRRIPADGSTRHFFRIYLKGFPLIFIYNPVSVSEDINENDSYYYIGRHLYNKGLPVPKIYLYDRKQGIFWIEDLGDTHLQQLIDFERDFEDSKRWYEKVLDILARFHIDGVKEFNITYCYDTPFYDANFILKRELNYFYREFLITYMGISPDKGIIKEFIKLSEIVSKIPNNFLMHRDFQSRNIMVKENKVFIIDFQGARLGPPTYDLASLIIDPYVDIPEEYQIKFCKEYFFRIKKHLSYSWEEFFHLFWKTALCRNLQVLGAFSFLSIKKKKIFFEKFIPKALKQLNRILEHYLSNEFPLIKSSVFEYKGFP